MTQVDRDELPPEPSRPARGTDARARGTRMGGTEMSHIGIWVRRDPGKPGRDALLLESLGAYAAAQGLPAPAPADIVRPGPGRKPYLRGEPYGFSVSHSGEYWACAVGGGNVGLDLQLRQPCNYREIARRFFTPEEQAYLRRRGAEAFFDLWAAKESYIKWLGANLSALRSFSAVRGDELRCPDERARLWLFRCLPGYGVCLCAAADGVSFHFA